MEINSLNSQTHLDVAEAGMFSNNSVASGKEVEKQNEHDVDSLGESSFNDIKSKVKAADQKTRSLYLTALKEAIADGRYNVSSEAIADSLIADGTVELLV